MAGLIAGGPPTATARDIPARTHLLAVAWLRWRIFANGFSRRTLTNNRQVVSLAFVILLRLIVWPFLAIMAVGPIIGSGYFAWITIADNHPENLASLLAAITLLWQFVAINGLSIAASLSSFDPSSLARFPLRFGRYLVLRTLLGLMTPTTVVGSLALMAAAVGIGIANPTLALPALAVMALYALMNIFLTRMIGAWMERWLVSRRFREIFGVLMAFFAIGIQFLNFQHSFQRTHGRASGMPHSWLIGMLRSSGEDLRWTPPGFAAHAILLVHHPLSALAQFTGLLASTALFAAVFAVRLHKQFLGEYLTEGPGRRSAATSVAPVRTFAPKPATAGVAAPPQAARAVFPPVIAACLRKEWLILRSNTAQFIALLTPLFFVVILSRTMFGGHASFFLPGAIAYVLLGVLASLYNVFGADGLGVQVYLLAPVRMRDVIVAKNLLSLAIIVTEAGIAWIVVSLLAQAPIPLPTQVSTLFWAIFVIATNLALGTLRSIQAPMKFVPGKTPMRRPVPTNRTSGLLIMLVLFGSLVLQLPAIFLGRYFHLPWLAAWIFGPLAAAAIFSYELLLRNADRLMLAHREVFAEALCKV